MIGYPNLLAHQVATCGASDWNSVSLSYNPNGVDSLTAEPDPGYIGS
jgi:hypothetical protein